MHVYVYIERESRLAFLSCMKALLSEDLGLANIYIHRYI